MKILLVYSAINTWLFEGINYGLAYISAVLKKENYPVEYVILRNAEDKNFFKKIDQFKPNIIGFSVNSSQIDYLLPIIKKIKKPENFIILGGIHPTLKPDCLNLIPEIDAIVRGEGELPMLELAQAFDKKKDYLSIKNFWFKNQSEIIKNEIRPLIKNLDELPFPDKSSLNYQKILNHYSYKNKVHPEIINRFIFSRGCPFNCSYCCNQALRELYPPDSKYLRYRSPSLAIQEIEIDARKYKFDSIDFDDDIININKSWFYNFFNLYKKNFKYPFRCNVRPATLDSDMVNLLKEAGVVRISIGLEHGNESFRRKILNRNISNSEIIKTHQLLKAHQIYHDYQVMVGLPYETKKMFLDTVKLSRQLGVNTDNDISIFHPYPGTALGEICYQNNWLPNKKHFKERKEAVIDYPNFKHQEIQTCHDIYPVLAYFKIIPLILPFPIIIFLGKIINRFKKQLLILDKWLGFISHSIKKGLKISNS